MEKNNYSEQQAIPGTGNRNQAGMRRKSGKKEYVFLLIMADCKADRKSY